MGEPARKQPATAADPFEGLGAVDPGVDPFEGLDAVPPPPPAAPAPAGTGEHARDMAAFDQAMAEGEPLRTRGRGIDAQLGPTTGEAAVRGLGSGATLRHGDEAQGFGAWLLSHMPAGTSGTELNTGDFRQAEGDIPRAAGRGVEAPLSTRTDYEVERNAARAEDALAQEHHPYVFGATEVVGGAAPAVLASATGAPVIAQGGGLGALAGEGASEAETPLGVARDAIVGGALGAGTAGLVEAGAPIIAGGVKKVAGSVGEKLNAGAETLHEIGTEQRLAGAGVERSGMRKLRDRPGGLDRYAEGADRMEIGQGRLLPSTVRQHAEDAQAAAEAAGAAKDAVVKQLEDAGATVHGSDVGAAIRKLKDGLGRGPAGQSARDQLERLAAGYDEMGEVPWSVMNTERKVWGDATNFDAGSVLQGMRKKIYGTLNESLGAAAERAEPGLGKAWRAANEDEHVALKLAEMGENKLNQAGNRAVSPTDAGAAGVAYLASGNPVAAGAAMLGNKALRSREHAIAAGAARGGEKALRALGGAAEGVAGAMEGAITQVGAPSVGAATGARSASAVDRALSDPTYGPMIAAHPPGQQRDIVYSTLLLQDPRFRERERLRAQQQNEEEKD